MRFLHYRYKIWQVLLIPEFLLLTDSLQEQIFHRIRHRNHIRRLDEIMQYNSNKAFMTLNVNLLYTYESLEIEADI